MRFLHLSDLHLGKRIFELSMLEEQRHLLDQVAAMAGRIDALLLAGDIYDRPVPPAEAVALFDGFLSRMSQAGCPVLMIAGNHDSAERVAFGAELMAKGGVYVAPVYDGQARCVTLSDAQGEVDVWLLPFVKPAHVRAALGDEGIEGYTNALSAAVAAMPLRAGVRSVLLAHQFVTGAARSESEEISVGGLDNVDAEVFSPFCYTALGHLHTAQSLLGGRVRYSGSPLCYAFSECAQKKGGLLVDLAGDGSVNAEPVAFAPLHAMRSLRGSFETLMLGEGSEDYLRLVLTDEDDVPEAGARLRATYPNWLQIVYDNARTRAAAADFSPEALSRREPFALFEELFEKQNGAPMDAQQAALLRGVMEKIWEGEA